MKNTGRGFPENDLTPPRRPPLVGAGRRSSAANPEKLVFFDSPSLPRLKSQIDRLREAWVARTREARIAALRREAARVSGNPNSNWGLKWVGKQLRSLLGTVKFLGGDNVMIIRGKDKGETGVIRSQNRVKKHIKQGPGHEGGIFTVVAPLHASNVQVLDPVTGKPCKFGVKYFEDRTKVRVSRGIGASGSIIPRPEILKIRTTPRPTVAATYSTSVVDVATTDCNFETQLTALPAILNTYPLVILMYLKILFTIFQCSLPGFAMCRLTTPTAWAMSGLVHIIENIKLPTADAYNTRDISILSSSLLGLILEDNLKLIGRWVEIGLQSCMLNCDKIFFK
ncbi:F-box/kelch-repeat protein SKIP30-like isoform X2 [Hibiscus syriacus]|uniref:F-box/kelch-repeat protein SKIP30-like isoform X2 n=1 Tax=Hibiscus syriacus TaxID=106335 RepID=A0A6A2Z172_HIBSY|nr:F-box/kelch-repeat protein SKIP30-like isoform X2 [Hibiscus syriacus]